MWEIIRIGETAWRIGCSERWLRDAEKRGIIPKARRDLNGVRYYTPEDVSHIINIFRPSIRTQ